MVIYTTYNTYHGKFDPGPSLFMIMSTSKVAKSKTTHSIYYFD